MGWYYREYGSVIFNKFIDFCLHIHMSNWYKRSASACNKKKYWLSKQLLFWRQYIWTQENVKQLNNKKEKFHSDEFTYGTAIIQRMFSDSNYEKKEIMDQEVRTQMANADRNDRVLAGIISLKDVFNIPRRAQSNRN